MTFSPEHTTEPFTKFETVVPSTPLADLNFNWHERDLPERMRTKHVHRLHPYLGKYVPQLVEIFLRKYEPKVVGDPFCGSGTTLVEANALGIASVGCDISAFNCLLTKVKTDSYDTVKLEREILDILGRVQGMLSPSLFSTGQFSEEATSAYLRDWFAPQALQDLLCYRSLIGEYHYQDVLKVILSRSARSSRLTTHFDLDFPKHPQLTPYDCRKHSRTCQPTERALQFLTRYSMDTFKRIKEFALVKTKAKSQIIYGDARSVRFPKMDAVITSPPYVGLINYHEQHRYAYELLGLPDQAQSEIGAATAGSSRKAQDAYIDEIGKVFANVRRSLSRDGVVVIVVHDKNEIYRDLAPKIGFRLEDTLTRHVNRRTGRRAGEFYEQILIWRPE